jgi:hypothetical protein
MDLLLSLAFGLHTNRGVYALLLGSGISSAAAIPTGWTIVLDLVRKLAAMSGESAACEPDPEAWFANKFSVPLTYGDVLQRISRTPAERQRLLRSYFEATPEEESKGQKQPTDAHKAIADLVKSGHVRLVLTTNFDRLIERSLEAVGVSPTVISTVDAVDGAIPLIHSSCTVIKLHGDYLDTRIKNAPNELAKYAPKINKLLDRVFDEFGLVVCGWSAAWDDALRAAITRCKSRRFTTYWAAHGIATHEAQALIAHRAAQRIPIADANSFFRALREKVLALDSFDAPHPLSAKTAVVTMKRFLSDETRYRIELNDMVRTEVERVAAVTAAESTNERDPAEAMVRRSRHYESITAILMSLAATSCYWSAHPSNRLWAEAVERLANLPMVGGTTVLIKLRRYPATLLLYAGGIAAFKAMNMTTLRALLVEPRLKADDEGPAGQPAFESLCPLRVVDYDVAQQIFFGKELRKTPMSDHLAEALREPLRDLLPGDDDYNTAFDRFEYLLTLLATVRGSWFPMGRFAWRGGYGRLPPLFQRIDQEVAEAGASWPPIAAGLFSSLEEFQNAAAGIAKSVTERGWR